MVKTVILIQQTLVLRKKCVYSELFWSAFSAFGLNTERYGVPFRIQFKCGKMRTRITPNTDTFHAVSFFLFLLPLFITHSDGNNIYLRNMLEISCQKPPSHKI